MWVRLIFENSTVCLISRRISLLCPVDIMFARWPPFLGVGGCGVAVSLTMILARSGSSGLGLIASFVQSGDVALIDSRLVLPVGGVGLMVFDGEFDPGSGRTLAACLTHASRAERPLRWYSSGERVSNT